MQFLTEQVATESRNQMIMPATRNDQLRLARVEQLQFEQHLQKVRRFLEKRPLMEWADSRPETVLRLILSEIEESLVELLSDIVQGKASDKLRIKVETALLQLRSFPLHSEEQYNTEKIISFFSEVYDQLFLILGFASTAQLDFNFDKVYNHINGQGNRSDVFDRLKLLAAGVLDSNPVAALEEYLIVWGSMATHQEWQIDSAAIMQMVLDKNEQNYPEKYFKLLQYIITPDGRLVKVPLTKEEFGAAFDHRVRCLRLIRRALKLAKLDRVTGMVPTDHLKYEALILNHQDEKSFRFLAIDLVATLGKNSQVFTFEQLVSIESEMHRVVAGRPFTSGEIYPGTTNEILIAR
ncbi:MAG TPA: hypothetical protein PKJ26_04930 [Candidatus Woesebacteria bacterium]|nr:hypothetical protein [Candidatus Woesebacteria bacterium]